LALSAKEIDMEWHGYLKEFQEFFLYLDGLRMLVRWFLGLVG